MRSGNVRRSWRAVEVAGSRLDGRGDFVWSLQALSLLGCMSDDCASGDALCTL